MEKLNKENLEKLGFELKSEFDGAIVDFVKKIDDRRELVLSITPMPEVFVWLVDDDAEDRDIHGSKIILDVEDIELAIKISEAIIGID